MLSTDDVTQAAVQLIDELTYLRPASCEGESAVYGAYQSRCRGTHGQRPPTSPWRCDGRRGRRAGSSPCIGTYLDQGSCAGERELYQSWEHGG